MNSTVELKRSSKNVYRMEDNWLWYLCGAFDTAGSISMKISKNDRLRIGYEIKPILKYSRPNEDNPSLGMVAEYAEENNIQFRFIQTQSTSSFTIDRPEDIRRFLTPIMDGLVQQQERAAIMLDEILPKYDDGVPSDRETALEIMEAVESLREKPIQGRKSSKYDLEFFKNEWPPV